MIIETISNSVSGSIEEFLRNFACDTVERCGTFRSAEKDVDISVGTLQRWKEGDLPNKLSPRLIRKALTYTLKNECIVEIYKMLPKDSELANYLVENFPDVMISRYGNKEFNNEAIKDKYDLYLVKLSVTDIGADPIKSSIDLAYLMLKDECKDKSEDFLDLMPAYIKIINRKIDRLVSLNILEKKNGRLYKVGGSSNYSNRLLKFEAQMSSDFYKPENFSKRENIRYSTTTSVAKEDLGEVAAIIQKHSSAMIKELETFDSDKQGAIPINHYIGMDSLTFDLDTFRINDKESL